MAVYLAIAVCWTLACAAIAYTERDRIVAWWALAGIVWPLAIAAIFVLAIYDVLKPEVKR